MLIAGTVLPGTHTNSVVLHCKLQVQNVLSDGQNILLAKYTCLCSCDCSDSHYRTYVAIKHSVYYCTICFNIDRLCILFKRCTCLLYYFEQWRLWLLFRCCAVRPRWDQQISLLGILLACPHYLSAYLRIVTYVKPRLFAFVSTFIFLFRCSKPIVRIPDSAFKFKKNK